MEVMVFLKVTFFLGESVFSGEEVASWDGQEDPFVVWAVSLGGRPLLFSPSCHVLLTSSSSLGRLDFFWKTVPRLRGIFATNCNVRNLNTLSGLPQCLGCRPLIVRFPHFVCMQLMLKKDIAGWP